MLRRIQQASRVVGDQRFEHGTGDCVQLLDYCNDLGEVVEGGGFGQCVDVDEIFAVRWDFGFEGSK